MRSRFTISSFQFVMVSTSCYLVFLQLVERLLRHKSSQPVVLIRPKLRLLLHRRRILALRLNLAEVKLLMLEVRQIVHPARVLRRNAVDLRQVSLRDDGVVDVREHLGCVGVQRRAGLVVHDALVELAWLVVLAELALVVVVALAADDGVGDLVGCFGGVGAELVCEAVWQVLLAAGVVGVDAHGAIDVWRAERIGHEGTVDWDLMEIDTDTVVLGLGEGELVMVLNGSEG